MDMDRLVVDSEGDPGLQSWSTTFHFETDQKRLNSIREVKARLKPLEDKIDRFNAAHHVSVASCVVSGAFVLIGGFPDTSAAVALRQSLSFFICAAYRRWCAFNPHAPSTLLVATRPPRSLLCLALPCLTSDAICNPLVT